MLTCYEKDTWKLTIELALDRLHQGVAGLPDDCVPKASVRRFGDTCCVIGPKG